MPRFSAGASPRLRATHALPLAAVMLLAVLFGTPGRHDGAAARAQSAGRYPRARRSPRRTRQPAQRAVPGARRAARPRPLPTNRRGRCRQERRLRRLPSRTA